MRLRATRLSGYGGAAKRLWTPAQLTTSVWLDAADASTITLNGSTVSQWNDKSGNARNAVQATTAYQPLYAQYQNLMVYSQEFNNAAWSKTRTDIVQNLVLRSQEFENAAWVKIGITVGTNSTTAPDGTTTAESLTETSAYEHHTTWQPAPYAANRYTYSIYIKPNGRDFAFVKLLNNASEWCGVMITMSTLAGTITNAGTVFTNASFTATNAGNGWVRVALTATSSGAIADGSIGISNSATPSFGPYGEIEYLGDNTKGIYVWGAQMVRGALAQDYTATTSAAVAIPFADPIGGTTAQKVLENVTVANNHIVSQATAPSLGQYTFSIYLKAGERTNCSVAMSDNSTGSIELIVNLSNGTLVTSSVGGSWSSLATAITSAGSGWYRVSISGIRGAGAITNAYIQMVQSGTTTVYSGNGQSGVYAWGGQLNSGAIQPYQRTIGIASPGGVNSKPSVVTDGTNDFMEFPAITVTDNTTYVYSVITRAASSIDSIDVGTSVSALTRGYGNWWFRGDNQLYSILRSSNPSTFGQHGASTATGNFINGLVRSDAGTQAYRNGSVFGTLQQTSGSFLSGPQLDRIGSVPDGASFAYNNGAIGEVIVGRTALSTDDRQKLEGYLAWKWGGA